MSKTRKKKRKKTNILLGFVCILLAVLLGFILVTNYKTEQEESKHLSEIAGAQQNGIEDYEAVKNMRTSWKKQLPKIQKTQMTVNRKTIKKNLRKPKLIQIIKKIQIRQKIQRKKRQQLPVLCAGVMI